MPKLIFELDNAEEDGHPLDADTLIHILHDRKVAYESLRREGETFGVNFASPEDAKKAFKTLDGMELMGSFLHIKPGRKENLGRDRGSYSRGDDRFSQEESENDNELGGRRGGRRFNHGSPPPAPKMEQYPCRILIPTDMIKVVLGKKGSTISGIQERTNTKIDIHRDKGPVRGRPTDDTLTTIKGQNEDFSNACKEIITVIDDEHQKMRFEERQPLQLKLLAHDSLCGRIIGKGGHNLKQVRTETGAKLIISNSIYEDYSLYDHGSGGMLCNGERIITIEGSVDSILHAEEVISKKLRQFLERDLKSVQQGPPSMMGHQPQFMGGPGILSSGAYNYPPIMYQRPQYGQGPASYGPHMSGYAGYAGAGGFMNTYPGILGQGYPPLQNLVPQPHPSHNDKVETSSVIIPTKEVGAVIGRKGEYISRVKQYSGAQVRVIKGEEGGDSRVEIVGTPDSQWKAQLCVYTKIKEGMKVPYSEARLKTEYLVPAFCVGRIIGKKGQVVQDIQDKSQTDIEAPKDKQGGSDVPVYITGTFNGLQVTLNRVRDIVNRALSKEA